MRHFRGLTIKISIITILQHRERIIIFMQVVALIQYSWTFFTWLVSPTQVIFSIEWKGNIESSLFVLTLVVILHISTYRTLWVFFEISSTGLLLSQFIRYTWYCQLKTDLNFCVFCKVVGKMALSRILKYTDKFHILDETQHGLRSGISISSEAAHFAKYFFGALESVLFCCKIH